MLRALTATSLLALSASVASAGGLDRSGQSMSIIFEDGNYAELGYSRTVPSISGEGVGLFAADGSTLFPPGTEYDDVANDFSLLGAGVKFDINDRLSAALIFDQPFGADVNYPGEGFASELGGTYARAHTNALTAVLRYKFNENFSAHGGLRYQRANGEIGLSGLAYGPVNGYDVELDSDSALGWLAGVAYERKDIALRVALTYFSEIEHNFDTTETGPLIEVAPGVSLPLLEGTSETKVKTPQAINLDFQTGIAPTVLLFGQIRWVEWSEFRVDPENFETVTGGGLVDLDDTTTYTIGIGKRFSEKFAGSISYSWEDEGDPLVSPLAPSNGFKALAIGGSYSINENVTVSGGFRYTDVGDSQPETGTPDVARADFSGNDAMSFGLKVGFKF